MLVKFYFSDPIFQIFLSQNDSVDFQCYYSTNFSKKIDYMYR